MMYSRLYVVIINKENMYCIVTPPPKKVTTITPEGRPTYVIRPTVSSL